MSNEQRFPHDQLSAENLLQQVDTLARADNYEQAARMLSEQALLKTIDVVDYLGLHMRKAAAPEDDARWRGVLTVFLSGVEDSALTEDDARAVNAVREDLLDFELTRPDAATVPETELPDNTWDKPAFVLTLSQYETVRVFESLEFSRAVQCLQEYADEPVRATREAAACISKTKDIDLQIIQTELLGSIIYQKALDVASKRPESNIDTSNLNTAQTIASNADNAIYKLIRRDMDKLVIEQALQHIIDARGSAHLKSIEYTRAKSIITNFASGPKRESAMLDLLKARVAESADR